MTSPQIPLRIYIIDENTESSQRTPEQGQFVRRAPLSQPQTQSHLANSRSTLIATIEDRFNLQGGWTQKLYRAYSRYMWSERGEELRPWEDLAQIEVEPLEEEDINNETGSQTKTDSETTKTRSLRKKVLSSRMKAKRRSEVKVELSNGRLVSARKQLERWASEGGKDREREERRRKKKTPRSINRIHLYRDDPLPFRQDLSKYIN